MSFFYIKQYNSAPFNCDFTKRRCCEGGKRDVNGNLSKDILYNPGNAPRGSTFCRQISMHLAKWW